MHHFRSIAMKSTTLNVRHVRRAKTAVFIIMSLFK